jgi:hypothetical protein
MPDSIWRRVRVASFALCRELHELTGWDRTHQVWNVGQRRQLVVAGHSRGIARHARNGEIEDFAEVAEAPNLVGDGVISVETVPAYDLGYLLTRVPQTLTLDAGEFATFSVRAESDGRWCAQYDGGFGLPARMGSTPEDATAWVCIELAKRGLLAEVPTS